MRKIKELRETSERAQYLKHRGHREELKPIVMFDAGSSTHEQDRVGFDFHPHSGLGILSYVVQGQVNHKDSMGNTDQVSDGGLQWMLTGGGVWHEEFFHRPPGSTGPWNTFMHQLWLTLPPEHEEDPVAYVNLAAREIPVVGPVKILLGKFEAVSSPIESFLNVTYLDVTLEPGQVWKFDAPAAQTRGFIYPRGAAVAVGETTVEPEVLGILEDGQGRLEVRAGVEGTAFVVLFAEPSSLPLIAGPGSLHSSRDALKRSRERLDVAGKGLPTRTEYGF